MVELREELELALEADDRERLEEIIDNGDPDDFETLRALVHEQDTPQMHRRRALFALGEWSGREEATVDTIESVLPRLTELERITALSTLGRIGTPEAREIVVQFRDDEAPDVRRQVVTSLARIRDETALEVIREMAETDELKHVREKAQEKANQMEER